MTESDPANSGTSRRVKVAKLIEKYELDGIGEELERRWTGQDGERDSLRTLADMFNRRLLERAMRASGMDPLKGEVENIYRLLTDEDVSSGTQTGTETQLQQQGINIDELKGDFVTYQAIRTYLKEFRDASYSKETDAGKEKARTSVNRLVGRTTAVVEQKLKQLISKDLLILGEFRVQTTVTIYCEDCETQYEATALLKRGRCNCESHPPNNPVTE